MHWIIDNLPLAVQIHDEKGNPLEAYEDGFPVGFIAQSGKAGGSAAVDDYQYYLYNHIKFKIQVHSNPAHFEGFRVVGFIVEPHTIKHEMEGDQPVCKSGAKTPRRFTRA